jgi:biopolymer transport protein ExbB
MPWLALICLLLWWRFLAARATLLAELADAPGRRRCLETAAWAASRAGGDFSTALAAEVRRETQRLRQLARPVDALTTAAPLLGLLGTVFGMVDTFAALAGGAAAADTARAVAGGISQALITTQVGLVIAVPGVFAAARLRRLARQASLAWEFTRSSLMPGRPLEAGG